jgi:hypothetical protein
LEVEFELAGVVDGFGWSAEGACCLEWGAGGVGRGGVVAGGAL